MIGRTGLPSGPDTLMPEGVAELVAELEDVADLDAALHLQRMTAVDARLARGDLAQVGPPADGDVPLDVDAAQVGVVDVGAGVHAAPPAQRLVGDHRVIQWDADRAEAAGQRAERVADLFRLGRADRDRAGGVGELLLVQRVVAAHQHQGEHAVQEVHQGLDLPVGRGLVSARRDPRSCAPPAWRRARARQAVTVRSAESSTWPAGTWPFLCWPRNRSSGSGR